MLNLLLDLKSRNTILFLLIFLPKINLIKIEGFWQGVRIDDLLILFYLIYIFFSKNEIIFKKNSEFKGWFYFFSYILIVGIVNIFSGTRSYNIMIIRLFEYFVLIIFFYNYNDKNFLFKILKIFLILNLITALLQKFYLIGSISSLGYLDPGEKLNEQSFGLLGGSWELAFISSIIFFIIQKQKSKYKILWFLITFLILLIANNRTIILSFLVAEMIIFTNYLNYINFFKNLRFIQFYFFLIIISFFVYKLIIIFFDYSQLITILTQLKTAWLDLLNFKKTSTSVNPFILSLIYRSHEWLDILLINNQKPLTYIFGSGFTTIYTDSTLVRIFLNFGFVGLLITLMFILSLPLYFIFFIFITGLTLDIFVSMKMFLIVLIFIKFNKQNSWT